MMQILKRLFADFGTSPARLSPYPEGTETFPPTQAMAVPPPCQQERPLPGNPRQAHYFFLQGQSRALSEKLSDLMKHDYDIRTFAHKLGEWCAIQQELPWHMQEGLVNRNGVPLVHQAVLEHRKPVNPGDGRGDRIPHINLMAQQGIDLGTQYELLTPLDRALSAKKPDIAQAIATHMSARGMPVKDRSHETFLAPDLTPNKYRSEPTVPPAP